MNTITQNTTCTTTALTFIQYLLCQAPLFSNCITSSGGFRAYKSPYGELYSHFTGILTSAWWTSCQHSSIKRTFPVSIQRLNTDIS